MKPVLAIHIGIHKTGTTSVQVALKENHDAGRLAQAGVNYVVATRGSTNAHHEFARTSHRSHGTEEHRRDLVTISEEVLARPDMLHLMSSEAFDLCSMDAHRVLRDHFLSSGIDLRILVTLRDAGSLLGSVFQQHLKQGIIPADAAAFVTAVSDNRGKLDGSGFVPYIHMDLLISSLSEIYGESAVGLIDYKKIFGASDGLSLFLQCAGLKSPATGLSPLPSINESLTLEKLSYLSWLAEELRRLTNPLCQGSCPQLYFSLNFRWAG